MTDDNNQADTVSRGDQPDSHPDSIGPYRLLEVLGEGGMAVVWLAEQSEPVKRRVALKILKPGMDSKQVVARFESERQALAVLDHPNIAKVFDGGVAESGRPYFVMEHVKGVSITDYCDEHRLDTEARISLFIDVCSAVQHAHHKGLIHRDLKPSNVLVCVVDGKPQPKIIDFGIAKATTKTLTEDTLFTRIGQILGTPQYMSPEQAGLTGLDVDTRTDVYSLGVILYELLVGAVPLDLTGVGEQAMQVALKERDPPKPSTRFTQLADTRDEIARARRTDVEGLRRQLSGDLDWVVMRAIEKDRTRRYETVNALAMECVRFLKHEPVLARPPSAGYLLRRFMQRNRIAVVAGSIAIAAILAGAASAAMGYFRAIEAERVALQEAETARQVSDFLVRLFEVSHPSEARGNTITAREILDKGAENIDQTLAGQPAVKSNMLKTMGTVYYGLGLYDQAIDLLGKAQSLATELYSVDDPRRIDTDQVLGRTYYAASRVDDAEALLLSVLERDTAIFGREHARVALDLEYLANVYNKLDRLDEAEQYALESVSIRARLYADDDVEVARALKTLAGVERELGKYDQALARAKQALAIFDSKLPPNDPLVASCLTEISINLSEQGLLEEQEPFALRALQIDEQVYGTESDHFATSLENVGILYAKQGKLEQAEPYFLRALATSEAELGAVHDSVAFRYFNLGYLYGDMQQFEKSEEYMRRSIEIWTEIFGDRHGSNAWAWGSIAENYLERGLFEDARSAASLALDINEEIYGPDHQNTAASVLVLANIARDEARYAEAKALYDRALQNNESRFGPNGARTREVLDEYLVLLERTGETQEAAAIRQRLDTGQE